MTDFGLGGLLRILIDKVSDLSNFFVRNVPDVGAVEYAAEVGPNPPDLPITEVTLFWVFIKTLTGSHIGLQVRPTDLVLDLKRLVQVKTGRPPVEQRFLFMAREMDERDTLADHG
jgi:hypothetical protein